MVRTKALTHKLREDKCRTSASPIKPLAPVTKISKFFKSTIERALTFFSFLSIQDNQEFQKSLFLRLRSYKQLPVYEKRPKERESQGDRKTKRNLGALGSSLYKRGGGHSGKALCLSLDALA